MSEDVIKPRKPPIGDPPTNKRPIKAGAPMEDPFTEQTTQPAGEGQGENQAQPEKTRENEEDAWSFEEGFSPIP
jgi:hypothetical protein